MAESSFGPNLAETQRIVDQWMASSSLNPDLASPRSAIVLQEILDASDLDVIEAAFEFLDHFPGFTPMGKPRVEPETFPVILPGAESCLKALVDSMKEQA